MRLTCRAAVLAAQRDAAGHTGQRRRVFAQLHGPFRHRAVRRAGHLAGLAELPSQWLRWRPNAASCIAFGGWCCRHQSIRGRGSDFYGCAFCARSPAGSTLRTSNRDYPSSSRLSSAALRRPGEDSLRQPCRISGRVSNRGQLTAPLEHRQIVDDRLEAHRVDAAVSENGPSATGLGRA